MVDQRIIIPAKAANLKFFGKFHNVPTEIVQKKVAEDLFNYCGRNWMAFILFRDGAMVMRPYGPLVEQPPGEIVDFCCNLAIKLNAELAMSGHWVVTWDNDRLWLDFFWRDEDGDIQFHHRHEAKSVQDLLVVAGVNHILELAHDSMAHWIEVQRKLQPRAEEQYKAALGQRAPSDTAR